MTNWARCMVSPQQSSESSISPMKSRKSKDAPDYPRTVFQVGGNAWKNTRKNVLRLWRAGMDNSARRIEDHPWDRAARHFVHQFPRAVSSNLLCRIQVRKLSAGPVSISKKKSRSKEFPPVLSLVENLEWLWFQEKEYQNIQASRWKLVDMAESGLIEEGNNVKALRMKEIPRVENLNNF